MPKFQDVRTMSKAPYYKVDVSLDYFISLLDKHYIQEYRLNFDPPYQRGYVWSYEQQVAYIEYLLKGGYSGKDFYLNHPGWMDNWKGKFEVIDGKQRITAILLFLNNQLPVFGHYLSDYNDLMSCEVTLTFHINNLQRPIDVVQWYIDMNTGGSIHTEADLAPAYELLATLKKEEEMKGNK